MKYIEFEHHDELKILYLFQISPHLIPLIKIIYILLPIIKFISKLCTW